MKKKIINFCLILAILFAIVMPISVAKGRDGQNFGIITVSGKEMYKSKYGEVYPIIIFNGKKCIKWHGFEITPVKDVYNCESGKSDTILKNFLDNYQKKYDRNSKSKIHIDYYSPGDKAGYNQMYHLWANVPLGNSSNTIGDAGCFITSVAAQLLRYGLKYTDYGHNDTPDPVNINTWFKHHNGFNGDVLKYDVIKNFPGIYSYVNDGFDDFSYARTILYRTPPNAPIECFRSQHKVLRQGKHVWLYHFCLYVGGDGKNPYHKNKETGYWELNQQEGKNHLVINPGFNNSSYERKGTVRTLTDVYWEGQNAHRTFYVRPNSGIFRVAFLDQ